MITKSHKNINTPVILYYFRFYLNIISSYKITQKHTKKTMLIISFFLHSLSFY